MVGRGALHALLDPPYYSGPAGTTYDITPDGRRFLMINRPENHGLVVVLNWIQELRPP